jgi:predicted aspartyl protease
MLNHLVVLAALLLEPSSSHPSPVDACTMARRPLADAVVQIPFDTVDGRIYVQARVNDQGPYRFAVDTGASGIGRADNRLVAALGLPLQGEATSSDGVSQAKVETVRLSSLALGGLIRRDADVIARDYNRRNAAEAAFDGIIARDFFADGLLRIDYSRRMLSFSRTEALSPTAVNARVYERAFRIPVSIDRFDTVGQLDTGANVAFVLPQALYEKVSDRPLDVAVRSQLTNGELESWRGTVHGPFRIGQLELADVEVRVSPRYPELLVGAHALQDAVVLIDQRSKAVAVCR